MHLFQYSGRIFIHFIMIDHGHRTQLLNRIAPYIDVLADTSLGNRLQLLMYHGDTAVQGIQRTLDLHFFSFIDHFPFVHVVDTEHALHQGGFAGSVLAHQGMNRTRPQIQLRTVQRFDTWKCLNDIVHLQTIV